MKQQSTAGIDPNITPEGISLEQIRDLTARDAERVRFFNIGSSGQNIPIVALPTVYLSDHFGDTRYFAEIVPDFVNGRFLEIGAGTGVITLAVALRHPDYFSPTSLRHVAVDINPAAVKNTCINAMINGLEDRVEPRQGDVFNCIDSTERFDCIFWNHPFHKGQQHESVIQRASFDPLYHGLETYVRDGPGFLTATGKLLLGSGNFADLHELRLIAQKFDCELVLKDYVHRPFDVRAGHLKTFNFYEIRRRH